tara:strand:+ start:314 stop:544 length:231 start_codon:yes stop_codon:yes gene_type:complete
MSSKPNLTPIEQAAASVRAKLKSDGFNKAAFAKQCGVPASVVKDIARDDWMPRSLENLIAIERALGMAPPESQVSQ